MYLITISWDWAQSVQSQGNGHAPDSDDLADRLHIVTERMRMEGKKGFRLSNMDMSCERAEVHGSFSHDNRLLVWRFVQDLAAMPEITRLETQGCLFFTRVPDKELALG